MSTMKPRSVLQRTIVLAAVAALAACGGGSDTPGKPILDPAPTGPTSPSGPIGPVTPPAPPTDPAPPTEPTTPELTLAAGYTDISATVTFSTPNWAAWSHAGTAVVNGVGCARSEIYHIHALLSIYRNGQRLALPDSIGRGSGCNYEMHAHDGSGVLHIETDVPKTFTLGQFFSLWGQALSATAAAGLAGTPAYYLVENEKITRVTTDPAAIVLAAHREIVIVTGTPPAQIPRYNWNTSGL
jgi:hypothetical protein